MRINGGLGAETEASEGEQATEEAQLALKVPTQKTRTNPLGKSESGAFPKLGVHSFPKTGLIIHFVATIGVHQTKR